MSAIEFNDTLKEILVYMRKSQARYSDFTSTHEALGVADEEFEELKAAIHFNDIESVRDEAIDLAAVCIRLANQCRSSGTLRARSVK